MTTVVIVLMRLPEDGDIVWPDLHIVFYDVTKTVAPASSGLGFSDIRRITASSLLTVAGEGEEEIVIEDEGKMACRSEEVYLGREGVERRGNYNGDRCMRMRSTKGKLPKQRRRQLCWSSPSSVCNDSFVSKFVDG